MTDQSKFQQPGTAPLSVEEINATMANSVLPTIPTDPLERARLKAKRVQILDRGLVAESLRVELPEDLYGEWGPNDPMYIKDMTDKGFIIDTQYIGDRYRVGEGKSPDVVHFITSKENKSLWNEVYEEEAAKKHGSIHGQPGDISTKPQLEEREAAANANGLMPLINESEEKVLDLHGLQNVLSSHIAEKNGEI